MKLILFIRSLYFYLLFLRKKKLSTDKLTSANKELFSKYLNYFPDNSEIAIAYVNNDSVTFTGVKIENDSLIYVENRDSVFEIGSITKVFTSIVLSKFVNDNLVKLEDAIKNYFDFSLKQSNINGKEITLKNLANHTSGLPRIDITMLLGKEKATASNPYKNYTEEKLNDYLKKRMRLRNIPGTKFRYSNLGGGLLAYILCKKVNKTFEELLESAVFLPYNMLNTTTELSNVKGKLVKGLTKKGAEAENWSYTNVTEGAGAIKSSVTDMACFIKAHFNESDVLHLPLQATFKVKKNTNIGLAWLITQKKGNTKHWHNGGTGGYRSCMAMDLKNKKGVILLSSVSAFHPKQESIDKLCFELLESSQ